ncbi:MAG: D-glycerate dehydrogenase, partial [Betaproteobacteria bacterium]|nr:D-glycerate dehydrogenase [Betaproteobacteria bacterium]
MKPKLLVARPIFQSVIDSLSGKFEITSNQADQPWTPN